jgi:hypothetical protein
VTEISSLRFYRWPKSNVGFGSNFAVRMASRRPNLPEKQDVKLTQPVAPSNTVERWFAINIRLRSLPKGLELLRPLP